MKFKEGDYVVITIEHSKDRVGKIDRIIDNSPTRKNSYYSVWVGYKYDDGSTYVNVGFFNEEDLREALPEEEEFYKIMFSDPYVLSMGGFEKYVFPTIRSTFPKLLAADIISTQSMIEK